MSRILPASQLQLDNLPLHSSYHDLVPYPPILTARPHTRHFLTVSALIRRITSPILQPLSFLFLFLLHRPPSIDPCPLPSLYQYLHLFLFAFPLVMSCHDSLTIVSDPNDHPMPALALARSRNDARRYLHDSRTGPVLFIHRHSLRPRILHQPSLHAIPIPQQEQIPFVSYRLVS